MRIAYELTSKYTSNYLDTFVSRNNFNKWKPIFKKAWNLFLSPWLLPLVQTTYIKQLIIETVLKNM